ncbi:MAG: malonic semialdehyde reductase [Deltaproteobacteria bacterium]|nr:malonic semialdehyde reductase [Deltaproteobacteria bacterium]
MHAFSQESLAQLFTDARTHRAWKPLPVEDATLQRLWEFTQLGPTSGNCVPFRVVFVKGAEARAKLLPCLDAGNVERSRVAPVSAVLAWDLSFPDRMAHQNPGKDVSWSQGNPELAAKLAKENGWLQAGYFILAARALGLDCGPMGGFDAARVDAAFLAGTPWRSFMVVNLGHGDGSGLFPRAPRVPFSEGARVL